MPSKGKRGEWKVRARAGKDVGGGPTGGPRTGSAEWLRDDALERSQSGRFASAFLVEADGT